MQNAAGTWKTTTTIMDGVGHVIHTQLTTDPAGADLVDTTYDGLGNVQSVSNPYRTASDPTYGITSYLYDALGRKTYQCQPDNTAAASTACVPTKSYQSWSYSGNVTTFTDENGNQWQRTTDALGRLTQVAEPSGSGASPTLATAYTYDPLDDLLSVKQSGLAGTDTARIRTFNYDSLSRLVCASNPENSTATCPSSGTGAYTTGTTGYGYDANGNLTSKTDARGVTTTYSYDALNRLLGKNYTNAPAGTLSSCYQYDTAANGVGRLAAKWTQSGACSSTPPSNYQSLRSYGAYDAMGRVVTERQCAAGYCTSASMPAQPAANCAALAGATGLQYCYDLAGDLLAYSNGLTTQAAGQFPQQALLFSQTFDAAARLNGVGSSWTNHPTHPQALFSSPTYTPFNALSSWLLGAQLTTSRSYDTRLRVTGQSSAQ